MSNFFQKRKKNKKSLQSQTFEQQCKCIFLQSKYNSAPNPSLLKCFKKGNHIFYDLQAQ